MCCLGEVHVANVAPSRLQRNVLPLSLAVNAKLGDVSLLGSLGCEAIEAAGATVSTIHVYSASGPGLPAKSVALTTNV